MFGISVQKGALAGGESDRSTQRCHLLTKNTSQVEQTGIKIFQLETKPSNKKTAKKEVPHLEYPKTAKKPQFRLLPTKKSTTVNAYREPSETPTMQDKCFKKPNVYQVMNIRPKTPSSVGRCDPK